MNRVFSLLLLCLGLTSTYAQSDFWDFRTQDQDQIQKGVYENPDKSETNCVLKKVGKLQGLNAFNQMGSFLDTDLQDVDIKLNGEALPFKYVDLGCDNNNGVKTAVESEFCPEFTKFDQSNFPVVFHGGVTEFTDRSAFFGPLTTAAYYSIARGKISGVAATLKRPLRVIVWTRDTFTSFQKVAENHMSWNGYETCAKMESTLSAPECKYLSTMCDSDMTIQDTVTLGCPADLTDHKICPTAVDECVGSFFKTEWPKEEGRAPEGWIMTNVANVNENEVMTFAKPNTYFDFTPVDFSCMQAEIEKIDKMRKSRKKEGSMFLDLKKSRAVRNAKKRQTPMTN